MCMRWPRGLCWRRDSKPGSYQPSAGRGGGRPVRVGRRRGAQMFQAQQQLDRQLSKLERLAGEGGGAPGAGGGERRPAPDAPAAAARGAPAGAPAPGAAAAAAPAGAPAAGGPAAGGAHAGASSAEREGCGEAPGDPLLRGPAAGGAGEQAAPEADGETPERRREAVRATPQGAGGCTSGKCDQNDAGSWQHCDRAMRRLIRAAGCSHPRAWLAERLQWLVLTQHSPVPSSFLRMFCGCMGLGLTAPCVHSSSLKRSHLGNFEVVFVCTCCLVCQSGPQGRAQGCAHNASLRTARAGGGGGAGGRGARAAGGGGAAADAGRDVGRQRVRHRAHRAPRLPAGRGLTLPYPARPPRAPHLPQHGLASRSWHGPALMAWPVHAACIRAHDGRPPQTPTLVGGCIWGVAGPRAFWLPCS